MNPVSETAKEAALGSDWSRPRLTCMILTLSSAVLLGLPLFLAAVAPRPQPPLQDQAPSLDPALTLCILMQGLATAAFFGAPYFWRRLLRRNLPPGQAWGAEELREAWGRTWILRYALGEAVCLAGALGLFLGYQEGLLPAATRFAWLCALPLGLLLWMLRHWPDRQVLHDAFFNS